MAFEYINEKMRCLLGKLSKYVKDKVLSTPVPDITNFKTRITDPFATITEDMLQNTWRESDCRLDVLRATKGAHVEVN